MVVSNACILFFDSVVFRKEFVAYKCTYQYAIPKINMLRNFMLFENEVKAAVQ